MTYRSFAAACTAALVVAAPAVDSSAPPASGADRVFVASTPCDEYVRHLLTIPRTAGCDFVRWRLALEAGDEERFTLGIHFGAAQPNTLGFVGAGHKVSLKGRAAIVRGPGDAQIYRLQPDDSARVISLLEVTDNLLHVLTAEGRLLGGNGGWSYTLNREQHAAAVPNPRFRLTTSPAAARTGEVRFDGRTPCREIAARIGISPDVNCFKVKWNLLLKAHPTTGEPATYTLRRTGHRNEAIEGRWEIRAGGGTDPLIYTLDPGTPRSLSFLALDDWALFMLDEEGRLLTGNGDFSYTLDRRTR